MEEKHNNAVEKVEAIMNGKSIEKGKPNKYVVEREMADMRIKKAREKSIKKARKQKEKQEKQRIKQEKREERERQREQNKEQRREKNGNHYGGWLAAVISLGVTTLALTGALTYYLVTPAPEVQMLETTYHKSFYEAVEQVDNIDLNLSKALATSDSVALQKYLVDTAINSEICESQIQQLPIKDENKFYTTKLINQIGDFSKYLNNKLARGESLSEEDMSGLFSLYQANQNFKNTLSRVMGQMGEDFSFSKIDDELNENFFLENFNELENLSVEYPELIYDGPFSDGVDRLEIKGLSGSDITAQTAIDVFEKIFIDYDIENVEGAGQTEGDIRSYNVQGDVNGDSLYAQISVKGGKLIMFAYSGSCNSVSFERDYVIEKAKEFLAKLGIEDMTAVWINLSNNVYTINFAPEENGVIIYSDLVKVRVCAQTAMVIGMEATEYYTNHTKRDITSPVLSVEEAMEKVSSNIEIKTSRLALVPIGRTGERLCYEFSGEYDGSTYYAYIDAENGRQVELFKVIKAGEGELLM